MNGAQVRMAVQPGDGVVARFGDLAAVVGIGGDADVFSRDLLDLLAVGSADRETLWRVAALLAERRSEAPPFGLLLGRSDSDRRLLLYGAVRAVVDDTELAGGEALTWLDRPVPADVQRVGVTLTAAGPVSADPRTDLGHGMLAGAGFVLEPVPGRPQSAAGSPSAAPEPVAPPPAGGGHVETAIRTPGRETVFLADEIAHLVAEDGSRVPLDRAYVLGRDPRQDPAVRRGAASPVFIPDPEHTVSRVQAYLDIDGGVLTIRDAASSNGTDVAAPGDAEWTRLGSEPFALPVGWSIRIGRRVYTYMTPGADAPA
jgi:FHA domain-containing protein